MKLPSFLRSNARFFSALGAVVTAGAAMTAAKAHGLDDALATLQSLVPGQTQAFQLALIGALGVGLGRFTLGSEPAPVERGREPPPARDAVAAKQEKFDRLLRHIVKLLQTHLADSQTYGERLDGANARLMREADAGPARDIVLALIDDNRDMRDKLSSVRNELEESRLRVMQLRTDLERAEEAGMRDVVTAIGNRRFFDACFAEEIEKARRVGDSFCLALADIDRFKHVNDRFGHLVGDRLLRLFADILVKNVRARDKVARFGGEEFALMFPGARLDEAVSALERIRGVLESKQWSVEPSGERVGKVTASFGVASLGPEESGEELLRRVDQLLFEAKLQGRNRVASGGQNDSAAPPPPQTSRDRRAVAE